MDLESLEVTGQQRTSKQKIFLKSILVLGSRKAVTRTRVLANFIQANKEGTKAKLVDDLLFVRPSWLELEQILRRIARTHVN